MLKTRDERFRLSFDRIYGEGRWVTFVALVNQSVRPNIVQEQFTNPKTGNAMTKPTYYKWEARAMKDSK